MGIWIICSRTILTRGGIACRRGPSDKRRLRRYAAAMSMPILYSFRRCPYAMRARLAILVAEISVELREVALRAKPAALLAASPKATVPVLVLADGRVVDQSLDIMVWALKAGGRHDWLSEYDAALIAGNDGPFKSHLDRYKYAERYGVDPLENRTAALDHLRALDDRLDGRACLSGDHPGFVDIAIMPFVRQFAATDRAFFASLPFDRLQRWLDRLIQTPMFETAMVRLTPWQPDDEPVVFPTTPTRPAPLHR